MRDVEGEEEEHTSGGTLLDAETLAISDEGITINGATAEGVSRATRYSTTTCDICAFFYCGTSSSGEVFRGYYDGVVSDISELMQVVRAGGGPRVGYAIRPYANRALVLALRK